MIDSKTTVIHNPTTGGSGAKEHAFTYDRSYFWDTKSSEVYNELCQPLLEKAMDGYNATVFAYGQTGAGKTYSMTGTEEDPGVIPLMHQDMFRRIESSPSNMQFLVTVSYLEIYQEVIYDLLNPSGKDMKVRQHPQLGIYVEDLAELVVRNEDEIAQLQEQGNKVRKMAATEMNHSSSRSHAVFMIQIEQKDSEADNVQGLRAKINLVDLAGSERADSTGAEGKQLKEGAAINKSLSALGNVINALADPKKRTTHVPYRDSKLTRILQESLGGNCVTVMLAMISPADVNHGETLSTLQYANRAKNIQNVSRKNEDENTRIIRELRDEIARLRQSLAHSGGAGPSHEEIQRMEGMISDLQIAKRQTWDEKEKLSAMFEDERRKNLASKGMLDWVMDTLKKENKEVHERLQALGDEKDKLAAQYKLKKKEVDDVKDDLQTKINDYSKYDKSEAQTAEAKQLVTQIHKVKERLKKENEELKDLKQKIRDVQEKIRSQKEDAEAHATFLAGNRELREMIEKDEREKVERENKMFLSEELDKMKLEIEQEKAELKLRMVQEGAEINSEQLAKAEMELIELRAEKSMMTLQIQTLEKEKQRYRDVLDEAYKRHKDAMEIQQLQHFQAFRSYREVFEEQKLVLEQRFRSLLQDAIQDAVFLATTNSELQQQNEQLCEEVAGLKDKLSVATAAVL
ncbi:kinesin-like protein KIF3B [Corticium candelabrum]|uniref:kinesin-like protein KIF3B n=1 Tax=Corticium candelabrum TaxID=121492 RepID=UPI002E2758E8|nr:kinesin-like protein KIF3B [Corticium candelabrum]